MTEDNISIANNNLHIILGNQGRGGILSFKNLHTAQELSSNAGEREGLYVLELDGKDGRRLTLCSRDAEKCSVRWSSTRSEEALSLDLMGHRELDIDVRCRVRMESGSKLSRWRMEVQNRSAWNITAISYPVMMAPTPLNGRNERQDEYLLVPFLDNGVLFKNPSETVPPGELPLFGPWNWRCLYPGMACAQMMAFYDERGGLYVATEDDRGHCKRFHPIRRYEGMDMSVEHFPHGDAFTPVALPYETILGVFEGDWYTAADLYKKWARGQTMCTRRLEKREDIPKWYMGAPVFIHYRVRGKADRAPGLVPNPDFHPPFKVPQVVRRYSSELERPVVAVAFGWEKHGPWYGPDYFPPFGGMVEFKEMAEQLHRQGDRLCMYVQPIWHYRSRHDSFEDRSFFESAGKICVAADARGRPIVHMRDESDAASFCLATQGAREVLSRSALGCVELGADIVQLDSMLGFQAHPCSHPGHPHQPGQGDWMYRCVSEYLKEIRSRIKERGSQVVLSTEGAPSELYIPLIDGYDSRRLWFTAPEQESVPLFAYLYHPFVLGFGGEFFPELKSKDALFIKAAQMMVDGLIVNLFLGRDGKMVVTSNHHFDEPPEAQEEVLAFVKQCADAQAGFASDYLIFGEALRPVAVDGIRTTRILANHSTFAKGGEHWVEIPSVLHSSWRSSSGRIGHVLASYGAAPHTLIMHLANPDEEGQPVDIRRISARTSEVLAAGARLPLDVELEIGGRSVVLVEQTPAAQANSCTNAPWP